MGVKKGLECPPPRPNLFSPTPVLPVGREQLWAMCLRGNGLQNLPRGDGVRWGNGGTPSEGLGIAEGGVEPARGGGKGGGGGHNTDFLRGLGGVGLRAKEGLCAQNQCLISRPLNEFQFSPGKLYFSDVVAWVGQGFS